MKDLENMKDLKEQSLASFNKILAPSLLALLTTMPEIQMPLILAYWFFWVVMQYKQDDVNNFVKIIQDNPWIFTKDIIETKEFQNGFVIILEQYIKERNKTKKEIIKNIFLWFTKLSEKEKEKFELEKLLDITSKITNDEIIEIRKIYKEGSVIWNEIVYWLLGLWLVYQEKPYIRDNHTIKEMRNAILLPYYSLTTIWKKFISYILENKS